VTKGQLYENPLETIGAFAN